MAIGLLALQAPLAADLRLVTAAIKINNDLERMGDLSVSIAQSALALIREPIIRPLIDIPHIAGLAQGMVRKALDAFVNRDAEMARSVLASDDAVDNMRTASYHELMSFMEKNPGADSASALSALGRSQSGTHRRPRDQHRRRRLVPGEGNRRAPSQRRTRGRAPNPDLSSKLSFFFKSSRSRAAGFAWPRLAFITCPTRNPITVVLPAFILLHLLGIRRDALHRQSSRALRNRKSASTLHARMITDGDRRSRTSSAEFLWRACRRALPC